LDTPACNKIYIYISLWAWIRIRIRIQPPSLPPQQISVYWYLPYQDPDWRFESGSNRIRIPIRNTAFQYFRIFTFRTYLQHQLGPFTLIMIIQHSPFSAYIYICTVRPVWSRGREGEGGGTEPWRHRGVATLRGGGE
jgi:hypothetical protein